VYAVDIIVEAFVVHAAEVVVHAFEIVRSPPTCSTAR
jgi:hypothetical protein